MFEPDLSLENALRFSRFDLSHPLSSASKSIELEGSEWSSAEHYLHANLAGTAALAHNIKECPSAMQASQMISPWYRRKKRGWKNLRRVYMTRALYTLVQMYPEIREYLLESGNQKLVESSLYDHYWGIGRDGRGVNMAGRVWMDIRQKLKEGDEGQGQGGAVNGES